MGQLPIRGQHQQTGGIDIESTNGDPATVSGIGKSIKYGTAAFRILPGRQFPFRFVIDEGPVAGAIGCDQPFAAVEFDKVTFANARPRPGNLVVDPDLSRGNSRFQAAP